MAAVVTVVTVVEQVGTVQELHSLDPFADGPLGAPVVWWCRPTDDAIVLGSRQADDLVDRGACARAGLSVARRRSGGGAVIVRRDLVHWIDVVAPAGRVSDDVRGSMVWIGELWRDALAGHTDVELTVHRGAMVDTAWSSLVCFAGYGPGEVLVGGRKLVGLSQRRTRDGIRVQGLVAARSLDAEYRPLLAGDLPSGVPQGQAGLAGLDGAALADALARRITSV